MKLRALALSAAACAVVALVLRDHARPVTLLPQTPSVTPAKYHRAEVNTYLTIPEWDLVWSPAEYADFIATHPSDAFPYLGHLWQFWQGYGAVWVATRDRYAYDSEYHTMIWVIGASTTLEYCLKRVYEASVGRTAEALRLGPPTPEDRLASQVAREYVDFIKVSPWYEFDFKARLARLWQGTAALGPDMPRKWERRYYLTSEYAAKAAYGWLLLQAARSAYAPESPSTAVVLDHLPALAAGASIPGLTVLEARPDGTVLALLPRYQGFTGSAVALAHTGTRFVEIAGNSRVILVGALVPLTADLSGLTLLFKQPILTRPGVQRVVIQSPVAELSPLLERLARPPFELEHVYDY